jgi:hypothetical protein
MSYLNFLNQLKFSVILFEVVDQISLWHELEDNHDGFTIQNHAQQ